MFRLVEREVQYVQLRLLLAYWCATNLQTCCLKPWCLGPSFMLVMNPQQLKDTLLYSTNQVVYLVVFDLIQYGIIIDPKLVCHVKYEWHM